ncbi:MAG: hypothetical protein LUE21_01750 [Oscillospiraceae bacterium]|nr:hypothetical protein [Oscillospiraceae bacterium]
MPIDGERIRARLKELSASEGGSLVMRRTGAALSGAAPVLFVGPASEGSGDDVPLLTDADLAAFGYRSVCFPRDEMAAYCADKVFTMVYDVWNRAYTFDQRYIDAAANACGIGSLNDIYRSVCRAIRFDPDDLRIKPGDTVYPVCHFRAPMDANNLSYTISAAGAKAQRQINALKLGASVTDAILSTVKDSLESHAFLRNYGPYGGLVLLNGREDAGIHGFIGHIDLLRQQLPREMAGRQWALGQARNRVEQAAVPLTMDRIFYNDKIEEFINACWGYSLAMFEEAFYRLYMDGVLRAVSAQLEAYAHETFDIYVPVMDAVRDILDRDAAAFAEGTLHRRGSRRAGR